MFKALRFVWQAGGYLRARWLTRKYIAVRILVLCFVAAFVTFMTLVPADTNGITHFDWIVVS